MAIKKRWVDFNESYDARLKYMAQFIKPDLHVLDLGAGKLALKNYLPQGCKYQPCDIVQRDENTIVCDFNKGEYPPLKEYGVVVCSGLLEYIEDLPLFISKIKKYSKRFVFSYAANKSFSKKWIQKRKNVDWVNHYTLKQISEIFCKENLYIKKLSNWSTQKVFVLSKIEDAQAIDFSGEYKRIFWMDFRNRFKKKNK